MVSMRKPDVAPGVIYEFWVDLPEHFRYCFPGNPGQLSTSRTRDLACAHVTELHVALLIPPREKDIYLMYHLNDARS